MMQKFNFHNQGQSLIGIIISLIIGALIATGLYYYLEGQMPKIPEITEKPTEEEIVKPEEATPSLEEEVVSREEVIVEKEKITLEKIEEKPTEISEEIPVEGKPVQGEIIESLCQDECFQAGLKKCSGDDFQVCGNYDEDNCLEWSLVIACPGDTICQYGNCIQQECISGPCCNILTKTFKSFNYKCQENVVVEYGCPWGNDPGSNVGVRHQHRYCSGSSADCDGVLRWGDWIIYSDCTSNESCIDGSCILAPVSDGTPPLKVAIIEFKYVNDPKVDFYYEFYCNEEDCIFRSPEQGIQYFINWCGTNCEVEKKSFFATFNNQEGVTNIYPIGENKTKYSYFSIYKLKEFYKNEAQKYGVDLNLDLDIKGPYTLSDKPPQRLRDESATQLEEFFDNEAQKQNIDLSKYDIINYVYFTSENYLVSTISGKKTLNQAFISFDEFFSSIMTITHEMGHIFEAHDTYKPGTWPCIYPEGYPEPYKEPLYPQSYACLMCKSIMVEENVMRAPSDFDEIVICDKTAEMFGWK